MRVVVPRPVTVAEPGWRHAIGLAAAIGVALLALTPATTLWDRDEPRFARAAVEMLASGDYLVPTFNGEVRAQKPPLVYWLMTLSLRVFGQTELAVRFWSPVGIAIAGLATFAIGRRLWSGRVGLTAMAILALSPLALVEGILATTDALLLAAISVGVAMAAAMLTGQSGWRETVSLGCALGAGLLIKGPVALLPLAVVAVVCAVCRPAVASRRRVLMLATVSAVIGISMYLAWLIPAADATAGAMVTRGLLVENVGRFLRPMEGHGTPVLLAPFYYPAIIAVAFAPWTTALGPAVPRLWQSGGWRTVRGALLLTWIVVPLALFTMSATKLPHYVLPIWPALALVVAARLRRDEGAHPVDRLRLRRLLIASATLVVIIVCGGVVAERFKPVPGVASAIARAPVAGPLFTYGFEEPSLVFYSGRPMVRIAGVAALVAWSRQAGEAVLVAPRPAVEAAERLHGTLPLREIAVQRGLNYANGRRIELVAFVRRPIG